nr:sodium-coupled monocarboxylate transporter 2-like [Onthophagus taurus]
MDIYFSWVDYSLLILMLILSAVIGVYYGFFKSQSSAKEYLLGGKKMAVWPIALSLISSTMSGLPLVVFPVEIYYFGIQFILGIFLVIIATLFTYYFYIPVFYKLQLTSTYEYLKLRFDNKIRILASIFYTIYMLLYLPVVIFVPALALAQVTGINIYLITPITCGVCIFYTTLGGMKAVVWTDSLQFVVMIGSMMIIAIVGIIAAGGLPFIMKTLYETNRLDFDFNLDPRLRTTFWNSSIGNLFFICSLICINQSTIQKCLSLSTFKKVKQALIIFGTGMTILVAFICICGMTMFGRYYDCDPLKSGKIKKPDQLLPYYIMDVGRNIPGLPGLFVSGILSAGLSTLSAAMNCLAATMYEDFIKPFMKKDISERKESFILKLLVLFIGLISTALVFAVEHLGSLFPLVISFMSVAGAPLLGLFTIGMLIPMVNSKGALCGGTASLIIMAWITIGGYIHRSKYPYIPLPLSTNSCINNTITKLTQSVPDQESEDGFFLYTISHNYYSMIAVMIVIVVSVIVSYFTKDKETVVNKDYISPVAHFLLSGKDNENSYHDVDKALTIVMERS